MHLKKISFKQKLLKAVQTSPANLIQYGQLDSNMLQIDTEVLTQASLQIKAQIRELKRFASQNQYIGLSALQGGYAERYFIISKEVRESQENAWKTSKAYSLDSYKAVINPKIIEICQNGEQKTELEESPSFPMIDAIVPRYLSVKVRYFDEDMEEVEETISNFESRTFQHFYDFLMNKDLINWRVSQGNISVSQPFEKQLKKFAIVLEDYKGKINKLKEDSPELFKARSIAEINRTYEQLQQPSFEQEMLRKMLKTIRKDLKLNITKLELDQIMAD